MQLLRWQTPDDLAQLDLRLLDDALRRLILLRLSSRDLNTLWLSWCLICADVGITHIIPLAWDVLDGYWHLLNISGY